VAISPNTDFAHYNLAQTWQMKGNLKQAIFHYRRAVVLNPSRKLFYYKLASALYVDDQPKPAISVLEKVLSLFPEDRTATVMLREYRKAASPVGTK